MLSVRRHLHSSSSLSVVYHTKRKVFCSSVDSKLQSNFPTLCMQKRMLSHFITSATPAAKRGLTNECFSRAINLELINFVWPVFRLAQGKLWKRAGTDLNGKKISLPIQNWATFAVKRTTRFSLQKQIGEIEAFSRFEIFFIVYFIRLLFHWSINRFF